ncbi:MAG TPA: RDD family protein [Arthrobacter sp.]|nr:RDD family protein [Arthrobacter sp.]
MSPLITGEAVVLELRPASFAARALGLVLDVVVQTVLLIAALMGVGAARDELDEAAAGALTLVSVVLCFVIIPAAVETLTRGLSLGKLAAGLRIVRDDGGAIRFRHAVIRALIGFLEIYLTFGGVAIAVALFDGRSRRLGDIVAGTYSLRRRVPVEAAVVPITPRHLAAWAGAADIGRIPDALGRRAALFMRQAPRMSPLSRSGMAAALATEVSGYVAPSPPPGTTPDDYLAAVLAERRSRELRRLGAARAQSNRIGERLHRLPFSAGRDS